MSLNLISNFASQVANRQLGKSAMKVTDSIRKLSSGSRVDSARDDAASMAIGSRIKSELTALKQVQLNASQATSLLQIAEGTVARVGDMLNRMKALATQAGSGNLSDTERQLLDVEFQALRSEIDRLTSDTKFNGNPLVDTNIVADGAADFDTNAELTAAGLDGMIALSVKGPAVIGAHTIAFTAATNTFTISDGTTSFTAAIPADMITGAGATEALVSGLTLKLTNANVPNVYYTFSMDDTFDVQNNIAAGAATTFTPSGTNGATFDFKIGTGAVPSEDQISITMQPVNTYALGLAGNIGTNDSMHIKTTANADAVNSALDIAIDTLIIARSEIGSTMNRIDATAENIAITVENLDAARSAYLDLDIAEEVSKLASAQVLQQAGVAISAQANQLPQNLLRLFQQ